MWLTHSSPDDVRTMGFYCYIETDLACQDSPLTLGVNQIDANCPLSCANAILRHTLCFSRISMNNFLLSCFFFFFVTHATRVSVEIRDWRRRRWFFVARHQYRACHSENRRYIVYVRLPIFYMNIIIYHPDRSTQFGDVYVHSGLGNISRSVTRRISTVSLCNGHQSRQ